MYNIQDITFYKHDEDGNELCDEQGNVITYTLKHDVDCSWICEGITEDDVEIIKEKK